MLSKTSQAQNFEHSELFYDEITTESRQNIISSYLEKIKSQDIEQVKIYLGMAYFVLASVLSLSLFL